MDHIREVLLQLDKNSLWECTCKCMCMNHPLDLFTLSCKNHFENFKFEDPFDQQKGPQRLRDTIEGLKTMNLFRSLKHFMLHLRDFNNINIARFDWTKATCENFLTFLVGQQ